MLPTVDNSAERRSEVAAEVEFWTENCRIGYVLI